MSNIKTRPFDAANYLRNEKDITEYLRQTLEEGDANELEQALDDIARARGISLNKSSSASAESVFSIESFLGAIRKLGYRIAIQPTARC